MPIEVGPTPAFKERVEIGEVSILEDTDGTADRDESKDLKPAVRKPVVRMLEESKGSLIVDRLGVRTGNERKLSRALPLRELRPARGHGVTTPSGRGTDRHTFPDHNVIGRSVVLNIHVRIVAPSKNGWARPPDAAEMASWGSKGR